MEARSVETIPQETGWRYEPKWDGFRCLARKHGRAVSLTAKSGNSLSRYFPEVVAQLRALKANRFTLDGELLVQDNKSWSFEKLQARLHPTTSRIEKLKSETPAVLMLFDILESAGEDLRSCSLEERRRRLDALGRMAPTLKLSQGTNDYRTAQRWLDSGRYEGVIAKRLDGAYLAGERAMLKVKRRRTADCVVGGFRYATDGKRVGSLLLGLYNDQNKLDHIGFTSGFAQIDRAALTSRLQRLKGGEGFSGNAPGGPSRWATDRSANWVAVKPKLVVEVSFDHVSGGRFRHGARLLRVRPDKAPAQCRMNQIE